VEVVAEDVVALDGTEGRFQAGEQPDALVEDGQVDAAVEIAMPQDADQRIDGCE